MILLDTDIVIDLLRNYPPALAWLVSLDDEEIVLPGFVVMELIQGCRTKTEQEKVRHCKITASFGLQRRPAMRRCLCSRAFTSVMLSGSSMLLLAQLPSH